MPSTQQYKNDLISQISGFQPEVTGGLCDGCNKQLSEDEFVFIHAYFDSDRKTWDLSRTSCTDCEDHLDDRELVEAIVYCELGHKAGEQGGIPIFPLHNPEVIELNTEEGAVIREQP